MNPYEILGARPTWKTDTIKKAYRKLSKKHHPDVGGNTEKFKDLSRAWAVLRDPERRKQFDKTGVIDESSIDNDFALMVTHLGQYIRVILDKGIYNKKEADLITIIIDAAQQDSNKVKAKREASEKEVSALNKLKTRITTEDGKRNLFESIVDQSLRNHNEMIIKYSNDERAFTMLLEELRSYSCATEVARILTSFTTTGTTSTTWR